MAATPPGAAPQEGKTASQHIEALQALRQRALAAADRYYGEGKKKAGDGRMENANAIAWAIDTIELAARVVNARDAVDMVLRLQDLQKVMR